MAVAILVMLGGGADLCNAQEVATVPPTVRCSECRIVLDSLTVLDGRRQRHVGRPLAIGYMSDGRVLLTPEFDGALVVVFDAKGRLVQTIGRQGEGPGEFKGVGQIRVGPEDTVRIYDHWNPRVSVFSSELELIETRKMRVPVGGGENGLIELSDGRLVTQRPIPMDPYSGFPVHLMTGDGEILNSFGAETDNPSFDPGDEPLMWRTMAGAADDRLWIAPTTEYSITLWDLSGKMHKKLVRTPEWFRPHPGKALGIGRDDPNAAPPDPGIIGLWSDPHGLLWVLILIPDEDWREGLGTVNGIRGPVTGAADKVRYWDTMIEVLDPERGELIASRRIDQNLGFMTGISDSGRVVWYREDDNGFPFIHVWQLRLEGRREQS